MALVECMKSELDLFTTHPIQASVLKTEEVLYKPVASLDNSSVIEFVSLGHGDTYRDLSSVYLKLRVKLFKNAKDEVYADDTNPAVVNNILHSLFKQCSIYLNGKPIAQTDNNYSYRAYIENLLNYGSDAATTHLESAGWYLDTGKMNLIQEGGGNMRRKRAVDPPPGAGAVKSEDKKGENDGLKKRKALFGKSCEVELMGKIHGDMFNQGKLLLNNVDLRVVFALEKPEFYIMSEKDDDTSYIKILDASMYMNHVTISPNILNAHNMVLQKSNACYPYKRVEVKSYTVPSGGQSVSLDNIVIGQIPNLLILGMIDNDAYSGKRTKNPFNFKHNSPTMFNLSVNGVQVPNQPIKFDYITTPTHPISTRGYSTLFKGTGIHFFDKGHQVTKNFYDNGCFLLAFDLTTDSSYNNGSCMNLLNQGSVRIEGQFAKALERSVTFIVYTEYDATIEIDKNRNVHTSF